MPTNNLIYHYCGVNAFLNIIQNSVFWLSDVRKSNDFEECILARDRVNSKIENILSENSEALRIWKTWYSQKANNNDFGLNIYTACFSENKDSLTQWTRYAEDGCGLSIGISKKKMQALNGLAPYNLVFNKTIYNDKKQEEIIDSIIHESISKMQYQGVGHAARELNTDYSLKFALCKHSSFKDEKEWRIVFLARPDGKEMLGTLEGFGFKSPKFRVSEGQIISYLDLDFSEIKRELIKEIWIGPKSCITKRDIKDVLSAYDYYEDEYSYLKPISIQNSTSSYR